MTRGRLIFILIGLVFAAPPPPSAAMLMMDGDQDCARAAAKAGAMSYSRLRKVVQRELKGKVVSARCEARGNDRFIYRFTVDQGDGKLIYVDVDARTGRILSRRGG